MSEQTKNKPNTAEIVVSIICALILIVTLGLFARNVINAPARTNHAGRARSTRACTDTIRRTPSN